METHDRRYHQLTECIKERGKKFLTNSKSQMRIENSPVSLSPILTLSRSLLYKIYQIRIGEKPEMVAT